MARRKIEHLSDVRTANDALRWLKKQDERLHHQDADQIAKQFDDDFDYEDRWFSDNDGYAQDLVPISNWRSWKREFEDTEGKNWWTVRGPGVLVRKHDRDGKDTPEWEAIQGLENYPIFDEDDHSNLEQETQQENWNDYGRSDLRSSILKQANLADSDAIEELMNNVDDKMLDELAYEYYESSGHYPEMEGTSTIFPSPIEKWDGSIMELGELLKLDERGYIAEVTLSPAAFDQHGRIVLRAQDLPSEVANLVNRPDPIPMKYKPEICNNPYLTCRWTGESQIAERQKQRDEDADQLQLPGVKERRRRRRKRRAA